MLGTVAALVGNRRVEPRELPVPELADDEILLGIGLTGVCGSDLHRFQDIQKTLDLDVPVVMGHEISGRVLPIAETQAAFELMEHPTDKPIKVAVRGAGY